MYNYHKVNYMKGILHYMFANGCFWEYSVVATCKFDKPLYYKIETKMIHISTHILTFPDDAYHVQHGLGPALCPCKCGTELP